MVLLSAPTFLVRYSSVLIRQVVMVRDGSLIRGGAYFNAVGAEGYWEMERGRDGEMERWSEGERE